jgi:hypothetical protein
MCLELAEWSACSCRAGHMGTGSAYLTLRSREGAPIPMRTAVVMIVLAALVFLTWPWWRGVVRVLTDSPVPTRPTRLPRIDVLTAPSVISPGGVLVIRLTVRDADCCDLAWRDGRSRIIPDAQRDVGLDGSVLWRLRLPESLASGTRALVVTAYGHRGKSRVTIPLSVLDTGAAVEHAGIDVLTLPDVPERVARIRLADLASRTAAFMGFYAREDAQAAEREVRIGGSGEPTPSESALLEAATNPSPDTGQGLFDPAGDRAEAAS